MPEEIRLFQPSNSIEGDHFHSNWCCKCARDAAMNGDLPIDECDDNQKCEILGNTFIYSINDPDYPKEWRYCNKTGYPICTAFVEVGEDAPNNSRDDKTIDMFESG